MSTLETKLDQAAPTAGRARCLLRRHLSGARVVASDARGAVRVELVTHGRVTTWVRAARQDGDWWFELEAASSP